MKRYLSLATTFIVLGAIWNPATGRNQDAEKKAGEKKPAELAIECPYYPLKIGNIWKYQSGGKRIVVTVTAVESINGMDCARLETKVDSTTVAEYLTVKTDGVYRVRANNQDVKPPLLILALKKAETWSVDSMVQNYALKGKFTTGEEKQLKLGKLTFDDVVTVKSSDLTMGEQSASIEAWYAKNIGMVKQHFKLPVAELDIVLELEAFEEAVKPGK